jgi:1,4-dihydroxy-2-naphthoate polyprenyltransferase
MTSTAVIRARPRPESKLRSYTRLAKLDVYDYYLGLLVVLAALVGPGWTFTAAALPALLLFGLGAVCVLAAMVAFDDVTGFRDGSDITNYRPDAPARRKLRKPLVAGTLTEPEALRFGWAAAAAGALLWLAAVLAAPHAPLWTIAVLVLTFVVSLQYSYGVELSYHGFQEVFLAALGWALVLAPYGLATGRFDGFTAVCAVLFGLGPLLFGVYSNTNDIAGDRAVGRPTVAALTSARGNARFVAALSVLEFAIGLVASLTGLAPWWFVLLMLPATALRTRQYLVGFATGDVLRARRIGFAVHRLTTALLVLALLLRVVTG